MSRGARVYSQKKLLVLLHIQVGQPNHGWLEGGEERGQAELVGPGTLLPAFPLVVATTFNIPMLLGNPPPPFSNSH